MPVSIFISDLYALRDPGLTQEVWTFKVGAADGASYAPRRMVEGMALEMFCSCKLLAAARVRAVVRGLGLLV